MLAESAMMVPDTRQRLEAALQDLENLAVRQTALSGKLLSLARKTANVNRIGMSHRRSTRMRQALPMRCPLLDPSWMMLGRSSREVAALCVSQSRQLLT